ncbi:MAG: hypothetical protein IT371_23350 [Deltaproteobacteria bacterium]|nr:hypothetical protein [Deltaproteobacteria bacterium]
MPRPVRCLSLIVCATLLLGHGSATANRGGRPSGGPSGGAGRVALNSREGFQQHVQALGRGDAGAAGKLTAFVRNHDKRAPQGVKGVLRRGIRGNVNAVVKGMRVGQARKALAKYHRDRVKAALKSKAGTDHRTTYASGILALGQLRNPRKGGVRGAIASWQNRKIDGYGKELAEEGVRTAGGASGRGDHLLARDMLRLVSATYTRYGQKPSLRFNLTRKVAYGRAWRALESANRRKGAGFDETVAQAKLVAAYAQEGGGRLDRAAMGRVNAVLARALMKQYGGALKGRGKLKPAQARALREGLYREAIKAGMLDGEGRVLATVTKAIDGAVTKATKGKVLLPLREGLPGQLPGAKSQAVAQAPVQSLQYDPGDGGRGRRDGQNDGRGQQGGGRGRQGGQSRVTPQEEQRYAQGLAQALLPPNGRRLTKKEAKQRRREMHTQARLAGMNTPAVHAAIDAAVAQRLSKGVASPQSPTFDQRGQKVGTSVTVQQDVVGGQKVTVRGNGQRVVTARGGKGGVAVQGDVVSVGGDIVHGDKIQTVQGDLVID